ncbi:MAG: polysaccharide biosynthesis/export family protein [Alphaproteobacteria bacterium]
MIASRFVRSILSVLVVVLLAACAETPVVVQVSNPVGSPDYHLGPGDKVKINVFNNPDVSGEAVLDSGGDIAMPLLGQVPAQNLTVTQLQTQIAELLNRQYLVDPKVSVEVLNYRPFFILGEVGRPGSYPYIAGVTVRQAVAIGGGYTRRARTSSVSIVRQTPLGEERIQGAAETLVLPGDTVEVGRRLF